MWRKISMENLPLEIAAELTPNPNTLKFAVNRQLIESGSRNFTTAKRAEGSPLPDKLFKIEGVNGVMIGTDFITVTKKPEWEWPALATSVVDQIRTFLESNAEPVVSAEEVTVHIEAGEIEKQIIEILDNEIRPAVARDGGDIVFQSYEDGVVKLHLQGACSSCPSSIMTLKMGIENRLKMMIPEVKEVVQV